MDDATDWARLLAQPDGRAQRAKAQRRTTKKSTTNNTSDGDINTTQSAWSPSSPLSRSAQRSRSTSFRADPTTQRDQHPFIRNPHGIARSNSSARAPAPPSTSEDHPMQQRSSAKATVTANATARNSTAKRRTQSPTMAATEAARSRLKRKLLTRAQRREPLAHTSFEPHSEKQSEEEFLGSPLAQAHQQHKSNKERIYCGNNAKSPELQHKRLGRPSECIQKGFGAALHQHVADVPAFLQKFEGEYEKLIEPKLWYKNSEPPPGWQRATLPMCFQKGWGAGTAALARKLRKKMSGAR